MGRNISVMVGGGGGQRPEHGTDNRHGFAIDWLGHKGGTVERAAGEGWWGAAPPNLLLRLSEVDDLQKREWGEQ